MPQLPGENPPPDRDEGVAGQVTTTFPYAIKGEIRSVVM
jgi:hypothetical protein